MQLGENLFVATAYDTLGNSASAELRLYGTPIPVPGTLLMLGSGLLGLVGFRKKFWQ